MITPPNTGLGKIAMSNGHELVRFKDALSVPCVIRLVPLAFSDYGIGLSIGPEKANPKVQARDARAMGLKTSQKTGLVKYPIPEEVTIDTRAVLSMSQVRLLIKHLEAFVGAATLAPLAEPKLMTAAECAAADKEIEESLVGAKPFGGGVILPGGPAKIYTGAHHGVDMATGPDKTVDAVINRQALQSSEEAVKPDLYSMTQQEWKKAHGLSEDEKKTTGE